MWASVQRDLFEFVNTVTTDTTNVVRQLTSGIAAESSGDEGDEGHNKGGNSSPHDSDTSNTRVASPVAPRVEATGRGTVATVQDGLDDLDDPEELDLSWDLDEGDNETGAGGGVGAGAGAGGGTGRGAVGDDERTAQNKVSRNSDGGGDGVDPLALAEMEAEMLVVEGKLHAKEGEVAALRQQVAALTTQNSQLNARVTALSNENARLKASVVVDNVLPPLSPVPVPSNAQAPPDASATGWWERRAGQLWAACSRLHTACLERDNRCKQLAARLQRATGAPVTASPADAGNTAGTGRGVATGGTGGDVDNSDWSASSWDIVGGNRSGDGGAGRSPPVTRVTARTSAAAPPPLPPQQSKPTAARVLSSGIAGATRGGGDDEAGGSRDQDGDSGSGGDGPGGVVHDDDANDVDDDPDDLWGVGDDDLGDWD